MHVIDRHLREVLRMHLDPDYSMDRCTLRRQINFYIRCINAHAYVYSPRTIVLILENRTTNV